MGEPKLFGSAIGTGQKEPASPVGRVTILGDMTILLTDPFMTPLPLRLSMGSRGYLAWLLGQGKSHQPSPFAQRLRAI